MFARQRMLAITAVAGLAGALLVAPAQAVPGPSRPAYLPDAALAPPGQGIVTRRRDIPVAPGVTRTSFDRLDARGWIRGDVLVTDLKRGGVTVDYLNPGTVSGREVLSQQAARKGAIGGVNGDFFDINDTGAPLGIGIERDADGGPGTFVNGPGSGHNESAVIGADGLGRLAEVFLSGTATDDDATTLNLTNLNSPNIDTGGVGLYTTQWGAAARTRTIDGVPVVREVILRNGVVVSNQTTVATAPLATGELALIGREAGASALTAFEPGERVDVSYGPRSDAKDIAVGISGDIRLAEDRRVLPVDDSVMHPRTAIGFTNDGSRMVLLTIDGRQADSRGMTEYELGRMMVDLGADDVLNLDGGGSSTMLARSPGEGPPEVINSPSDGTERLTPNGLGLLPKPGSGRLTGFRLEPFGTAAAGPDVDTSRSSRVLAGLSRVIVARGHDETYAPVAGTPRWGSHPGAAARVAPGARPELAIVTGRRSGRVTVVAAQGHAYGATGLQVLGAPTRIAPTTRQLALPNATSTGRFGVTGDDADGFSTWVEPRDVTLEYDQALIKVAPDVDGFVIAPVTTSTVSTVVTVKVGGLRTELVVTVGLHSELVDEVDDLTRWKATSFPAVVGSNASAAAGHDGGSAIALDYSLTGTTVTRAAYLEMVTPQSLPGQPQKVGAWVHGDGQGAWLRAHLYDEAGGAAKTVNLAAAVDWTGWRYVEADIPPGLAMPLRFWRLYVVETVPTRQYAGRIVVDDLTARGAPPVSLPPAPRVTDPVVITDGELSRDRWKFAVLSDAQFTADDPESEQAEQARRTIREALSHDPEFLVINGDFVDRGFANDIALAKRIIDEEVAGRVPVRYVPGNHEAYGPGDLSEWTKVFGSPWRTFDHNGTRFVLRDSSLGSLRAGGFDQILDLRRQLDDAAGNRSVENVVVMAHHPINDPLPTANSQLGDRKEADMLVGWLADFRARTGKGASYMAAHAGTFAATRTDGVPLPLTGNSGKGPASAPDAGGFTGWALVGISDARAWMQLEFRPHVDELELTAPVTVAAGRTGHASATVLQGDVRRVPVAFPVSADWWGSWRLHVGPADEAPRWAIASYDPSAGIVTGLRPGTVHLAVTVNDVTRMAAVTVTR